MLSPAYALIPNCQHHQRRLQQFQRKLIRIFMSLMKSKICLSPILRQNGLEQKVKLQWEQQFLRSWNAYPRLLGLWIMLSYLCLPWVILCFCIVLSSACCQVSYLCCFTSSSFTIITGRFCILVIHSLMLCYRVTSIDVWWSWTFLSSLLPQQLFLNTSNCSLTPSSLGTGTTSKSIILEKNSHSSYGFSVMLRYCGQWS